MSSAWLTASALVRHPLPLVDAGDAMIVVLYFASWFTRYQQHSNRLTCDGNLPQRFGQ